MSHPDNVLPLLCLTTLIAVPTLPASAQTALEERTETPEATAPDGYRWGPFLVRPELGLSLLYDSNIYATRSGESTTASPC